MVNPYLIELHGRSHQDARRHAAERHRQVSAALAGHRHVAYSRSLLKRLTVAIQA
jgi:hypothetical protein